jgi:hypothetical protein
MHRPHGFIVVGAAVWLPPEEPAYVTGASLTVDGGVDALPVLPTWSARHTGSRRNPSCRCEVSLIEITRVPVPSATSRREIEA